MKADIKQEYDIQQGDILKVGRVKFAVKEIHYKDQMECDVKKPAEEFEEYEEILSLMKEAHEDVTEEN